MQVISVTNCKTNVKGMTDMGGEHKGHSGREGTAGAAGDCSVYRGCEACVRDVVDLESV